MQTAILLGAGNRGFDVYGQWALTHPDQLKFVAVADADPAKLERFAKAHQIDAQRCFLDWRELLSQPQLAPIAFDALPDLEHEDSAMAALDHGYHLMLEKPVASTLDGVLRVAKAVRASQRVVMLGYVLRYTNFFNRLRELVRSGRLGELITLEWRENVSAIHMAHSFVRGNWSRQAHSSPMILAKCSHDLDMISWVTGKQWRRVSSFGGLQHFKPAQAPEGVPDRCLNGCPIEQSCAFHAGKIYLGDSTDWPTRTIGADLGLEARRRALETGPYGRCVYKAGNDVVDHQVVAFEFADGGSGTLTMHGHSGVEGRTLRIDGSKATLHGAFRADLQEIRIEPHNLASMSKGGGEVIAIEAPSSGHGGGDAGLVAAFLEMVRTEQGEAVESFLESHFLAFAIEQARQESRVVELEVFKAALTGMAWR